MIDKAEDAPKQSLKEKLKGWGSAAKKFLEKASDSQKKFVSDESYRKETAKAGADFVKKLPEKYISKLISTTKHEVKEFKEAGEGIAAVMKGGKMSAHQKKAFKTVATHMAIGIAAAAFSHVGIAGGAAIFVKNLARHIAMKAASKSLGNAHMLQELGHIGHGIEGLIEHFAAEGGDGADPEKVMANYISAAVASELGGLSESDLRESLKHWESEESEEE